MITFHQLISNKKTRIAKYKKTKHPALKGCPQRKATCMKVYTTSPKKPNSAVRKVAKVLIMPKKRLIVYIPGIGHSLQKYSNVLVRGGRVRDLPGVGYKMIRGVLDFNQPERYTRQNKRSKYGVKRHNKDE